MSKSEKQMDLADRKIEVMFLSFDKVSSMCVYKFWSEILVLVPEFVA